MTDKYEVAEFMTVEAAQLMYEDYGIATIVTDGKYVQMEREG